jgi:hypothetical protein
MNRNTQRNKARAAEFLAACDAALLNRALSWPCGLGKTLYRQWDKPLAHRDGGMFTQNWVFVDMIHLFGQMGYDLMAKVHELEKK